MHEVTDGKISITRYIGSDANVLCEANGDPEHRKRFDFPDEFVPSLTHAQDVIASWDRDFQSRTRFAFAVRNAETGELQGGCELQPKESGAANVSYWVHPRHRRKGIASRAVKLLSVMIAPNLGFCSLELLTDNDNLASRGVARNCAFAETEIRDGQILHVFTLRAPAQQGSGGNGG